MSNSIVDDMIRDMTAYTEEVKENAHRIAKNIRNRDMVQKLTDLSPVRNYSTHTQVVSEIIVHRNKEYRNIDGRYMNTGGDEYSALSGLKIAKKAIHKEKGEQYQPGYFKKGWVKHDLHSRDRYKTIYGVRNKNIPTVVHLLNYDHELITHNKHRGVVHGTGFVDNVSDEAMQKFDSEFTAWLESN